MSFLSEVTKPFKKVSRELSRFADRRLGIDNPALQGLAVGGLGGPFLGVSTAAGGYARKGVNSPLIDTLSAISGGFLIGGLDLTDKLISGPQETSTGKLSTSDPIALPSHLQLTAASGLLTKNLAKKSEAGKTRFTGGLTGGGSQQRSLLSL